MAKLVGSVLTDSTVLDLGPVEVFNVGWRVFWTVNLDSNTLKSRHVAVEVRYKSSGVMLVGGDGSEQDIFVFSSNVYIKKEGDLGEWVRSEAVRSRLTYQVLSCSGDRVHDEQVTR